MKCLTNRPEMKPIEELMGDLYEHIRAIEGLQEELAQAIENYADDSDDVIAEMDLYLEDAIKSQEINEMLYMELSAERKELLRLIGFLHENGISPPDETYVHYGRLNPDKYAQDPDSPFYFEDPDEHFLYLLQNQYSSLRDFEALTPMTSQERTALRTHVIRDTGLQDDYPEKWMAFLKGLRARTKPVR